MYQIQITDHDVLKIDQDLPYSCKDNFPRDKIKNSAY